MQMVKMTTRSLIKLSHYAFCLALGSALGGLLGTLGHIAGTFLGR